MNNVKAIKWENDRLVLLDCTKLPIKEEYIICKEYATLIDAINCLAVRGAPAIGIAAAYGVVLAAQEAREKADSKAAYLGYINEAIQKLAATRPTAVNLFWALDRVKEVLKKVSGASEEAIRDRLLKEAETMYAEDIACNMKIGENGNEVVPQGASILTHCNAGALATAAYGTALGVVRAAHDAGKDIHVFADETRPLLQGARMTAWEMAQEGIPCTLITDSMAGYVMKLGKVDLVVTGADRITLNGDTANKIGTYSLAVLAKEHGIPFYIAAPLSTIDITLKSGDEIEIEERDKREVKCLFGVQTAPDAVNAFNPAFDVTPNEYITGIITEKGILGPPYEVSIGNLFKKNFFCIKGNKNMEELDYSFTAERQKIVDMSLKLYRENLIVGTWGNLSMRVNRNGTDYFVVTPSGMEYEDTTLEDVVVLDKDGNTVLGSRRPTSELGMHMKLYEERKEINAIIHTHSTCATACAVVGIGIPMMVEDMIQHIGGNVRIAKYALPGTKELAENVCHAIEDRKAVLLKNHGALGMGETLKAAYKSCILTEKSAQILIYAKNLGHINLISSEDAEIMVEYYRNQYGQQNDAQS